jgi:hypothetical protein
MVEFGVIWAIKLLLICRIRLTNKFGNFFKRKQEWKLSGVLNLIAPPPERL